MEKEILGITTSSEIIEVGHHVVIYLNENKEMRIRKATSDDVDEIRNRGQEEEMVAIR